MSRNRKGKLRSKNMRRRMRKPKALPMGKILESASKAVTQDLKEAKTIGETRRAITILKLFGSFKAHKNKVKYAGKKVLFHPLPPKASVMAVSMVMAWTVIGLSSAFGQWANMPLPDSVFVSSQKKVQNLNLDFSLVETFKYAVGLAEKKAVGQVTALINTANSIKAFWPSDNFTIAYNQPVLSESKPKEAWARLLSNTPDLAIEPQGKVLGANTTEAEEIIATSPAEFAKQLEDKLIAYVNQIKSEEQKTNNVGQAKIPKGSTFIKITFSNNCETLPIITATPLDFIDGQYRVTAIGKFGFIIQLSQTQNDSVAFNWQAAEENHQNLAISNYTYKFIQLASSISKKQVLSVSNNNHSDSLPDNNPITRVSQVNFETNTQ